MELAGLNNEGKVYRVRFPEDSEIIVGICYQTRENLLKLREEATDRAVGRKGQIEEKFNALKSDELLGAAAVKSWGRDDGKPAFTMNGAPFEHSEENVKFMMRKHVGFARFVNSVASDLAELEEAERMLDEKK